jgi:predicted metal-dependent hydrolase
MWLWHAMEEVEHKAVAFDVFLAATRKLPGVVRYLLRTTTMAVATVLFFWAVIMNLRDLFREDGVNTGKTWRQTFRFLFVEPGLMRAVLKSYFRYYKPGFHPWEEDDRAILAQAQATMTRPAPVAA